jgi:ArsR family transcriptional regulator
MRNAIFALDNAFYIHRLEFSNVSAMKMSQIDVAAMERAAGRAAALLRALGNEHRLRLLCQLAGGERAVGELVAAAGLSQSAVSQHLARLRAEGIVATRRAGQAIFYSLAAPEARRVIAMLYELYCRRAARCRPARRNPPAAEPR